MRQRSSTRFVGLLLLAVAAVVPVTATVAAAQTVGTFRWQQQPYCNVLTLTVTQNGGIYHLDGFDDQCGAAVRASASGLAFPNPNGTIGFGLTVVTSPGATPVHVDATITLAALSGTWRDSSGVTGAWTFLPGPPTGGSPRPPARVSFPAGLSAGGSTIVNVGAPATASDAANRAYVDSAARAAATLVRNVSAYATRLSEGIVGDGSAGCLDFEPSAAQLHLDLDLPLGATPTAVALKYIDTSSSTFTMSVRRYVFANGVDSQDVSAGVHSSTNGVGQGNRVAMLALAGAPAVSATQGYYLIVTAPAHANGAFAFCGAQVSYTMP